MPSVFEKLNLKSQTRILVVDAPPSFEPMLSTLAGVDVVRDSARVETIDFALAFVTRQVEVDAHARTFARICPGDATVWFAYPKGSSKRLTCDFNRDTGWDSMRAAGFDTVRQVAIDEDWTALRFRRTGFIRPGVRTAAAAKRATRA